MNPREVTQLRKVLRLTQLQLAALLGVHPMTVSKWERGVLSPTKWQREVLQALVEAGKNDPAVGQRAVRTLLERGVPAALYVVFQFVVRQP